MQPDCKWEPQPLETASIQHFSLEWPQSPNAKAFTLLQPDRSYSVFHPNFSSQHHAHFVHAESTWKVLSMWRDVISNFSLNIFWSIWRLYFSLYKLLICQSEREILKRLVQRSMISWRKWSLSASPAGIFLQGGSSAGQLFSVHCVSTMVPFPILLWISPLPRLRTMSRIMQSMLLILRDLLWVCLLRIYMCASLQQDLKTLFSDVQGTGSCKSKEYWILPGNGISVCSSFCIQ